MNRNRKEEWCMNKNHKRKNYLWTEIFHERKMVYEQIYPRIKNGLWTYIMKEKWAMNRNHERKMVYEQNPWKKNGYEQKPRKKNGLWTETMKELSTCWVNHYKIVIHSIIIPSSHPLRIHLFKIPFIYSYKLKKLSQKV